MHRFMVGIIIYVAFVIGIVIGGLLGSQQPIVDSIRNWQTLIAAAIALIGILIAWFSVGRQPRVTIISREEDRIEKILPGLYDASALLNGIVTSMVSLKSLEELKSADDFINIQFQKRKDESTEEAIKRTLELTDHPTQIRALKILLELEWRANLVANIYKMLDDAKKKVEDNPNNTTAQFTLKQAEITMKTTYVMYNQILSRANILANEIDEKIRIYSNRLPRLRAEIEKYFHDDKDANPFALRD